MDISTLKTGDKTFEVKRPDNGAPLGLRITVVHIDDERLKTIKRQVQDKRNQLAARGKAFKAEEIESNQRAVLFAATVKWEWYNPTGTPADKDYDPDAMPDFKGEQPDFNRKNFNEILTELPWIESQLIEECGETESFFNN